MLRGIVKSKKYRLPFAMAAVGAWTAADLWAAGSHHRYICGPDGSCPPNAYHFGFYQTQWRTWPTPARPEDQRRPEAVTLPKVQTPGVTEEDLDAPPQPKGTPKAETQPDTGDDPLKLPPKTDLESKQPPPPGIDDILRPPTDILPKTKLPTKPDPAKPDPAKPNPFKDDPAVKDKELSDILKGFEENKKPAPSTDKVPPLRPVPAPGDLPAPKADNKIDDPLKDLPKFEGTKTSATGDLSGLDLSPRPRPRQSRPTTDAAPAFPAAVIRTSAIIDMPPRPNGSGGATTAPREDTAEIADNPLRSGWSARRGPSPLRPIEDDSTRDDGEKSWNARKNPLREK